MEANWRIRQFFQDISDDDISSLRLFHVELLRFNQKLNLISTYTEQNSDLVHFYDCIKAVEFIKADSKFDTYYDIGSGNGFPGVVFAILAKDRKINLVEVDNRKSEFLKHIVARLQLNNATVLNIKAEDLNISSASGGMCRAFSNLARTLLLGNKIFPMDSTMYSLKGPDWFGELASLPSQICSTWNTEMAYEYDLPENLGARVILRSNRIG